MDIIIRYKTGTHKGQHTYTLPENIEFLSHSAVEKEAERTLEFDLSGGKQVQIDMPTAGFTLILEQRSFKVLPLQEVKDA